MTQPNESAFARPSSSTSHQDGLTKREYFAAMAMQGLLTRVPKRHNDEVDLGINESSRIAQESVLMADLLIEELNKQP